jgi:SAM-dependent methyltransferase
MRYSAMEGESSSKVTCPVCASDNLRRILELKGVPVFCNVQSETKEEALSQPVGDIHLEHCGECDHVFNSAFDATLLSYSESYENSLHFSETFSRFAEKTAGQLVKRFSLFNKRVIDIGCGKGDFLSIICELGGNEGFGFDKSFEEGRAKIPSLGSVRYFKDFYSHQYSHINPDLVTCRHVLEHVAQPTDFLDEVLKSITLNASCDLYFEVPNALFTLRDMGIWDLIYEHCHYFSPLSLRFLFVQKGVDVETVYDCFQKQFLGIEANYGKQSHGDRTEIDLSHIHPKNFAELAEKFEENFRFMIQRWESELGKLEEPAVVWGAGSKGATFLNLLNGAEKIAGIVDINPNKQGRFVACAGHEILAPQELLSIKPTVVYVMNPVYSSEIAAHLERLGVSADVRTVH